MTITASADGSALGNPGPTGWAWYIDHDRWAAGGAKRGTNNIGELTAVLELLRSTKAAGLADEELEILCDSQYVINSVTKWMHGWKRKGWKKADGKPVLNVELMKAIDAEMQGRNVRFQWVKGHAGHAMNEAADERARAAATAYQRGTTPNAGPGLPSEAKDPQEPRGGGAIGEVELDLFSDFTSLQEERGFSDPCATSPSAAEAERALWRAVPGRQREAVVGDAAVLVGTDGRRLTPPEWAAHLAELANGEVSLGVVEATPVGTDVWSVDTDLTVSGTPLRVTSTWTTRESDPVLVQHRVGEMQ